MSDQHPQIDWEAAKRQLRAAEAAMNKALVADAERIEQVYAQRATQMENRHRAATASAQTMSALVFSLGSERYAIAISELAEVLPAMSCTPAPRAAPELAGVINLRGDIRSVIDLARLLSLPNTSGNTAGQILMIRTGDSEVGLKVGRVEGVQPIREDELASLETGAGDTSSIYFRGLGQRSLIVLNVSALLTHPVFNARPH